MLGISVATMIDPQSTRSPRISSVGTPTESMRFCELEMNVNAYTNSFTTSENEKITTVRMPGTEIGKTMRTSVPSREAPSIRAASSSSRGIVLKNPINNQVAKGTVKEGYTSTRDQIEP